MTLSIGDAVAKVGKDKDGKWVIEGEAQHIFLVISTESRYVSTGDILINTGLLVTE